MSSVQGCHNIYLAYKRDTSRLVYWLLHSSNMIIAKFPQDPGIAATTDGPGDESSIGVEAPQPIWKPNTSGGIAPKDFLPLAKLIANHICPIPSIVFNLFQSVIGARRAFNAMYQQAADDKPDRELERQNKTHKYFVDALNAAFEALGGKEWMSKQKMGENSGEEVEGEVDIQQLVLANKFSGLEIQGDEEGGSDAGGSDQEGETSVQAQRPRRQKGGGAKGKKGKKGRKGKQKKKAQTHKQEGEASEEKALDGIPIESYRIINDEDGIITEYLMACYAVVKEWADLRGYVQGIWKEVAYDGLNGAVAGAVSNMAIAMIKQSAVEVFADFPDHDSYETIMETITRGNIDKAQGMFRLNLYMCPEGTNEPPRMIRETKIDIREQFMIHAYQHLLDFVTDFQKSRSGRPTKSMLPQIADWNPTLDLQRATKEERLKWRRSFAINWLYDLVNIFSAIVAQRNTLKGERHVYDKVDWSTDGPWDEHRRLFGLNEFAGEVTTLAMQKQGTDIRKRISPHLVFQFQCILDSLTVSRGWSLSGLRGHVLQRPARNFRPRRDVDMFLDRENKRDLKGYLRAVDVLRQILAKDAQQHWKMDGFQHLDGILEGMQYDFNNWLGETKYMYGLQTIPGSRFSSTHANGLWEYSPFLCGIGLMEALELAYRLGMKVWDSIPEPFLLIHLHNALVQKGYIKRPVGLYGTLEELLPEVFFVDGKAPKRDFQKALLQRITEMGTPGAKLQRKLAAKNALQRRGSDIHSLLNLDTNRFFSTKSNLILYRQADWDPLRVPESDVKLASTLAGFRIGLMEHAVDPTSGQKRVADSDLVRRARAAGMDDQTLLSMAAVHRRTLENNRNNEQQKLMKDIEKSLPFEPATPPQTKWAERDRTDISREILLACVKLDIQSDVSGDRPLSSLNLLWVTCVFFMLWSKIEDKLKAARNPSYVRAYEKDPQLMKEKRVSLATLALAEEDEECLRIMADAFQNPRAGFMNHIYWDNLETIKEATERLKANKIEEDEPQDGCVVM